MNSKLNLSEQEEIDKISASFNLDSHTKDLASNLIVECKQKCPSHGIHERFDLIVACAILAASKSQVLSTVTGGSVRGIGISITQLMRVNKRSEGGYSQSKEFLATLKDLITRVTLDPEVVKELQQIIDKFGFSSTFFTKYKSIIDKLMIQDYEEYITVIKNFGWILFIIAKQHILHNRTELCESVHMLTAVLSHLLCYLPPKIEVKYFEKASQKLVDPKTKQKNLDLILEVIGELLNCNSTKETLLAQKNSFEEYLLALCKSEEIKRNETELFNGIFDYDNIRANLKSFEAYYEKNLKPDDIDERFYMKEKKIHTPSKFTPFARQGAVNRHHLFPGMGARLLDVPQGSAPMSSNGLRMAFQSQRILNYEISENVNITSNLSEIKFLNLPMSQSPAPRLVPATPMTTALEMFNWLNDKIKKCKKIPPKTVEKYSEMLPEVDKKTMISRVDQMVDLILDFDQNIPTVASQAARRKSDYKEQIRALFFTVLEELLVQEEKKVVNQNFSDYLLSEQYHRALIACCIEITFFVNNNLSVSFKTLLEFCKIDAFDFWSILTKFMPLDPHMPWPIKKHLHELETKILSQLAWEKDSQVHQLVLQFIQQSEQSVLHESSSLSSLSNETSQDPSKFPVYAKIFTKNSLSFSSQGSLSSSQKQPKKIELSDTQKGFFKRVLAHTAFEIKLLCDLLKISDTIAEHIWSVMKYILSSETSLLIGRHLTQLIACTIYGVSKTLNCPIKFQDIAEKYYDLPNFNEKEVNTLLYKVPLKYDEQGDVIKFYNTVYLVQMKQYLSTLISQKPEEPEPRSNTNFLKKPIIEAFVLASPLRDLLPQSNSVLRRASPLGKFGITPLRSAKSRIEESPARNMDQMNTASTAFSNNKRIDFDDNFHEPDIKKKQYFPNPLLEKIIEQRFDESQESHKKGNDFRKERSMISSQGSFMTRLLSFEDANSQGSNKSGFFGFSNKALKESGSNMDFNQSSLFNKSSLLDSDDENPFENSMKLVSNFTSAENTKNLNLNLKDQHTVTPAFKK